MTASDTALGGFVKLHFVPGGFVDPWFRFAAGPDLPTGAGADERGVLSFREWALGLSFGHRMATDGTGGTALRMTSVSR